MDELSLAQVEKRVINTYVDCLVGAQRKDSRSFDAFPGVIKLWAHLRERSDITIAVASGDWREAVEFKLGAAGVDLSGIPLATASDAERRVDIIRCVAERAGRPLREAIYIGNGPWDFAAATELGIGFIGVGNDRNSLSAAGVMHLLDDMHPETFFNQLERLKAA